MELTVVVAGERQRRPVEAPEDCGGRSLTRAQLL